MLFIHAGSAIKPLPGFVSILIIMYGMSLSHFCRTQVEATDILLQEQLMLGWRLAAQRGLAQRY